MNVEREIRDLLAREADLNLTSLERLAVRSHSPNWRGVCADGRSVVVKLVPQKVRLAQVAHPLAAQNLYPHRTFCLGDKRVYVLDWKEGTAKALDELTADELDNLMMVHAAFCRALGEGMIHGDFNCHNVLFAQGKVSGILDLEAVRTGHPCEDWVRYTLTGAEHLPVFAFRRRRRVAERFGRLVARTNFSAKAWQLAIQGFATAKRSRKSRRGRLSLFMRANLAWRERFYRQLSGQILQGGGYHGEG